MFEITGDDIALLNDEDLRGLIGRLCESEVRRRGLPASSVTWGGNQNAADGGLDVRVALPPGTLMDDFVPRSVSGFQVKKPDMARKAIISEMCPHGVLRPVIKELAAQGGAYIIVSSTASTTHLVLQKRLHAMAEAVGNISDTNNLILAFYDRGRVATWVGNHAGLIPWVRNKIGKTFSGWRPYGPWAYAQEGLTGKYLLDDKVRIGGLSALEGITYIRDRLRKAGIVLRLVGLSGVGKTRFVQALFDDQVGEQSLDSSLAVYTDMADGPDPQPTVLASDLIATRTKAILVIDNCPPDLHRRLSDICRCQETTVSVITVEYDIREDQQEGTEVVRLEPSSNELIEKLLKNRFPKLSTIDARTIANSEFSGGNARIAIVLAETVGKDETIAGLNDEELFQRLFQQRHAPDASLLLAAEACSLVYSFQGEDVSNGDQAELVRLGSLVGKDAQEMYRCVAELQRRDLVQRRSVWRAVLPHAIANRLAATALENIPLSVIEAKLVTAAQPRLLQSFSRRLGYLHKSKAARDIANAWLGVGGLLQNVAALSDLGIALFENIAPVVPEAALAAIERALLVPKGDQLVQTCTQYVGLLRSIAYDGALFERCASLILIIAEAGDITDKGNKAPEVYSSLFLPYLSGTHATIEQRLRIIEPLLLSTDHKKISLGVMALKAALQTTQIIAFYDFEFGAHSRDHGSWLRTKNDRKHWFGLTLKLSETLACSERPSASQVRVVLAEELGGLWISAGMYDEVEHFCRTISEKRFWAEGWIAVRQAVRFHAEQLAPVISARLMLLEELLRPKDLVQKVRSIVLSSKRASIDFNDFDDGADSFQSGFARTEALAQGLGKSVAGEEHILGELLPELLSGNGHLWPFGRGLFEGSGDPTRMWNRLVSQLSATTEDRRNIQVLRGFLHALHQHNSELANVLLDDSLEDKALASWFPVLQTAVEIDKKAVDRLMRSLVLGKAPIGLYENLAFGQATHQVSGEDLKNLVLTIAAKPGGFVSAVEILYMRLHSTGEQKQPPAFEIIDAGQQLMRQLTFARNDDNEDYRLGAIARSCLIGDEGAVIAREICCKLKASASKYKTHAFDHDDLLDALFSTQSRATLDVFFPDDAKELELGIRILNDLRGVKKNPLNVVPESELFDWCDKEPKSRSLALAATITISDNGDKNQQRKWTKTALRLLEKAPNRADVLRRFAEQFRPMSWSGSRASIIESNAMLLDELGAYPDPTVTEFVAQEKIRLRHIIEAERQSEVTTNREKDERFE